jgi:hypothetical protein
MRRLLFGCLFLASSVLVGQNPESAVTSVCAPSATTLCLNDSRFSVRATWTKSDHSTGSGSAVALTGDTGYFWFFDQTNIEVVVKVLNACSLNAYWVFASGLTNVGVILTITDTATGQTKTYNNPVNSAFEAVQDTSAFETCGTPTSHTANVTGTWIAALTVNGIGPPAFLSLTQSGSSVTGTASVFDGGSGVLTGTVTGQTFNFSVAEVSPCSGSFTGSVSVSDDDFSMSGSGSGADCNGSFSRTLTAAKTFVGGAPAAGSADVSGSWNATLSSGGSQYSAVLTFVQNGTSLSGTVSIVGFGNGSFTGSIVGDKLIIAINELNPCLGIFIGASSNASGSSFTGNIVGSDCGGSYSGTFSATKR